MSYEGWRYEMRHRMNLVATAALVAAALSAGSANARPRVEFKPYDGHAINDCGATYSNNPNRTEVCFDIQSGDRTLDLIIHDDSGLPVAAAVYFEDDHNTLLQSRGSRDTHALCNRGDTWRGGGLTASYDPVFSVPPLATKVLINLGDDTLVWDSFPLGQCLGAGRPGHWGTTGTIEAIFKRHLV